LILIFSLFFSFWAVRQIKLAIPSAFERTLIYRIVSYRKASPPFGLYSFYRPATEKAESQGWIHGRGEGASPPRRLLAKKSIRQADKK